MQSRLTFSQQLGFITLAIGAGLVALVSMGSSGRGLALGATLLALVRIAWAVYHPPGLATPRLLHLSLLVFFLSAVIGAGVAYDSNLSWPLLIALAGTILVFYAIFDIPFRMKHKAGVFIILILALNLYFILFYASFDYQAKLTIVHKLGLLTGVIVAESPRWLHRNAVAAILEGAFLLALGMVGYQKWRSWWWLALGIIAYGLLLTVSRGSWLAVAAMSGIWLVLRFEERWQRLTGGAVLALIIIIGGGVWLAKPAWLSGIGLLSNDSGRGELFGTAIYLLKDFWLTGIGLGEPFAMVYSKYVLLIQVPFLTYSHNLFLQIGLGQGIVGLLSFALFVGSFYWYTFRHRNKIRDSQLPLFDGAWLGVSAILLHGFVDASQFVEFLSLPPLFILMAFNLSFNWRRRARENHSPQKTKPLPPWLKGVGWASLALLLFIVLLVYKPVSSMLNANLGALTQVKAELTPGWIEAQRAVKMKQAQVYFQASLGQNPDNSVANRWLGIYALNNGRYEEAISYLEMAFQAEPNNFTLWKALGYAYLWQGDTASAKPLLERVPEAGQELSTWAWWWDTQSEPDLAERAEQMRQALEQ